MSSLYEKLGALQDRVRNLKKTNSDLRKLNQELEQNLVKTTDILLTVKKSLRESLQKETALILQLNEITEEELSNYSILSEKDLITNLVIKECAKWKKISPNSLTIKKSSTQELSQARHLARHILRYKFKGFDLKFIASITGNVDHTSLYNSFACVENRLELEPKYRRDYEEVYSKCLQLLKRVDAKKGRKNS